MKKFLAIAIFLVITNIATAENSGFIYNDSGRRDPFWPLVSASGAPISYGSDFLVTDLVLEGIMADPDGNNFAVVNGRVTRVNDHLGEYIVTTVTQNSVILLKGEQKFELKLKKEE